MPQALTAPVFHPVQGTGPNQVTNLPEAIVLRAYEVYCGLYAAQPAIVNVATGCRGGFGTREIIAYLYARTFPESEWRDRVQEACVQQDRR